MTDMNPTPSWAAVRQLEIGEFALGGANGNMNEQAKSLAARSELLKQYVALPYESKTGGYALNERVQLATGDIVRSTIPSNVNNPNVDMTGWKDLRSTLGLGNAAFKNTGTQAGNVMEVGAFGLGLTVDTPYISPTTDLSNIPNGLYGLEQGGHSGIMIRQTGHIGLTKFGIFGFPSDTHTSAPFYYGLNLANGTTLQQSQAYRHTFYTTQNTTVDSNGFIKKASPIVKLFADKIESNNEAQRQEITFEKLAVGDYLIKGSSGFAQEGWYFETPKDANGNVLVAVVYEQLENGDISVKTYDYMLNKKGRIVADIEVPLDIPESRWVDLRLQELPQPEIKDLDEKT